MTTDLDNKPPAEANHIPDAAEKVELKACPFCGESESLVEATHHYTTNSVYYVECKGHVQSCINGFCNTEGPRTTESIEEAIRLWNTRHDSRASLLDLFEAEAREVFCNSKYRADFGLPAMAIIETIIERQKAKECQYGNHK